MTARSKEEVVQEYRIQSLQDATMRVIARKGIGATTVQDIADEAGVAKGTIYLYFRDRDELVEKTFESAISRLHGRIDEALEAEGSLEQRLRESLLRAIEFFRESGQFFRLYIAQRFPEGTPQQQRKQQRQCDQYRTRIVKLAALFEEAMQKGEIRRTDAYRLALFFAEGTNAIIVERVMEENPPPAEDDVDLIVATFLDGIRIQRS
ncbi:MAG TPA: helix-turn-helix domain-containing protein [Thermoanaerobaculia bacterium]|nr:helix-turn-helix domain-containing protein [Thermoanaerobaculia bacterium]